MLPRTTYATCSPEPLFASGYWAGRIITQSATFPNHVRKLALLDLATDLALGQPRDMEPEE